MLKIFQNYCAQCRDALLYSEDLKIYVKHYFILRKKYNIFCKDIINFKNFSNDLNYESRRFLVRNFVYVHVIAQHS